MAVNIQVLIDVTPKEIMFFGDRAVRAFFVDMETNTVMRGTKLIAVPLIDQRLHRGRARLGTNKASGIAIQAQITTLIEDPR